MNKLKSGKIKFKFLLLTLVAALIPSVAVQVSLAMQGKGNLNIQRSQKQNDQKQGSISTIDVANAGSNNQNNEIKINTLSNNRTSAALNTEKNELIVNDSIYNDKGEDAKFGIYENVKETEDKIEDIQDIEDKNFVVTTENNNNTYGTLKEEAEIKINVQNDNNINNNINKINNGISDAENLEQNNSIVQKNQTNEIDINTSSNQNVINNDNIKSKNEINTTNNVNENDADFLTLLSEGCIIDSNFMITLFDDDEDENDLNEAVDFTNQAFKNTIRQAKDSYIIRACIDAGLTSIDGIFLIRIVNYLKNFQVLKTELSQIFDNNFEFNRYAVMGDSLRENMNVVFNKFNQQLSNSYVKNANFKFSANYNDNFEKALGEVYATLWDYFKNEYTYESKVANMMAHRDRINLFIRKLLEEMEPSFRKNTENYKIYKEMFSEAIDVIFDKIENMPVDFIVSEYKKNSGLSDEFKNRQFSSKHIWRETFKLFSDENCKNFGYKVAEFIKNIYYSALELATKEGKIDKILKRVPNSNLNDTKKWLENIMTKKANVLFSDVFKHKDDNADTKNNYEQFCKDVDFLCDVIYKEVFRITLKKFIDKLFDKDPGSFDRILKSLIKEKELVDRTYDFLCTSVMVDSDINKLIEAHKHMSKDKRKEDDKKHYHPNMCSRLVNGNIIQIPDYNYRDFEDYSVSIDTVRWILDNCVNDGANSTKNFIEQILDNEYKLINEFGEYDERSEWARFYRCRISKIFYEEKEKLCGNFYEIGDSESYYSRSFYFSNAKSNSREIEQNYIKTCKPLKEFFVKRNAIQYYKRFKDYINTVTGFLAGRDVYKACYNIKKCDIKKDFIASLISSFRQKMKNIFLSHMRELIKEYAKNKFDRKTLFKEFSTCILKEFGFSIKITDLISEENFIYARDLDLDDCVEKFFLLFYQHDFWLSSRFLEHIIQQTQQQLCSLNDLKVESLFDKAIKYVSGECVSPGALDDFLKNVIQDDVSFHKLREIFDKVFLGGYFIKFYQFITQVCFFFARL